MRWILLLAALPFPADSEALLLKHGTMRRTLDFRQLTVKDWRAE
jgi:hypothetical protein